MMWNLPPPPGFQGLRDDLPLEIYVRHLPHWRQDGATYFVTFRLDDSLPQSKLHELDGLRREWEARHPPPHSKDALEELARLTSTRVEAWLDEGQGGCVLKEAELAAHVIRGMHHFDGVRYELDAYVVMPNHVHAIVRPTQPREHPLELVLKSWKQFSATQINKWIKSGMGIAGGTGLLARRTSRRAGKPVLNGGGPLWQDESYDRIIRDCEHLDRCLQYIGANPRKAGLSNAAVARWVRPEWIALGWQFRDET